MILSDTSTDAEFRAFASICSAKELSNEIMGSDDHSIWIAAWGVQEKRLAALYAALALEAK